MKFNLKNRPSGELEWTEHDLVEYGTYPDGSPCPIKIKNFTVSLFDVELEKWFEGFENELRLKLECEKRIGKICVMDKVSEARLSTRMNLIKEILGEELKK